MIREEVVLLANINFTYGDNCILKFGILTWQENENVFEIDDYIIINMMRNDRRYIEA